MDTALSCPRLRRRPGSCGSTGWCEREITLTFDDLLRRPLIEDYITLTCVSNPVGGPYIGNAKWLGASLASLLQPGPPAAGANQLLCTSVDGFTSGTPLAVVLDGRDALLAVAMNGTALPVAHGFPVRMVVPGLYGYVSATKWVTDIEVTTFAASPRLLGAARLVTAGADQDRVPHRRAGRRRVAGPAGPQPVAGVAWAQHKGIDAVEVRVDGGPWHEAAAGRGARHRHLAAVGLGMARHAPAIT